MPDIASIIGMLDRDGALHLGDAAHEYGSWPEQGAADQIHGIDFASMGNDAHESDSPPANLMRAPAGIRIDPEIIDAVLSGPNRLRGRDNAVPPPHVWAWYQPIHFFGSNWGIFLRESALVDLARDLAPRFESFRDRRTLNGHVAVLIRAGFAYLFLHEQYHHKIESLAIRMHVIERRAIYPDYMKLIQRELAGTPDDTEEALAGVDAFRRLSNPPYSQWFRSDERGVVRAWMLDLFEHTPPPYNGAADILSASPEEFDKRENQLAARVQEAMRTPTRPSPEDFTTATHLMQPLFPISHRLWSLVPAGREPLLPTLPGALPLQASKLERWILSQGWELVAGGGKGSHAKYRRDGRQMIVLPYAKDVSSGVLSTIAQTIGVTRRQLVDLAR